MQSISCDQMESVTQLIAQAQTSRRPPPFDNTLSMRVEGREVRFLVDPCAEKYLFKPTPVFLQGMLPPEDFEVMAAVFSMVKAKNALRSMSLFQRVRNRSAYLELGAQKTKAHLNLIAVSAQSKVHRAAMQRIYHSAPSPLKEMLLPYACR